jgi:hypothetical protein
VSGRTLGLALFLATADVVLVNWSQPLFGGRWKHVMWEGGVVEDLTALQFILGAVVDALCAFRRDLPVAHRRWFVLYAVAMLVLAGEETNYGRRTLFLNLTDPNFDARLISGQGRARVCGSENAVSACPPLAAAMAATGGLFPERPPHRLDHLFRRSRPRRLRLSSPPQDAQHPASGEPERPTARRCGQRAALGRSGVSRR